jgi:predicted nucleotidyltransferase/DNA-binding XRE family transcriptional regulator
MADLAGLIRDARVDAGLSQKRLAERAGTSQPALARYETGSAQPSIATLERLLAACGRRLELVSSPANTAPVRASSLRGQLGPRARRLRVCRGRLLVAAREHGVRRVRVFGSLARGEDLPESDVDLLVELGPGRTLLDLAAFRRAAQEILAMSVDVATSDMLKERIRAEVLAEALPL